MTPAEALIAIHGIDPERDGIPLKKAMIILTFELIMMDQQLIDWKYP